MDGEVIDAGCRDFSIWGNARDVLAAPDEDQHAYGILRKCCRRRRRYSAMAALLYAATTCCRSVQSQSHLWFSESDAGDMATALTWKLLDRFPLPSPRQPAPPFHLTPALRRYESHSNYQFTSSSSSICRYLATNRLCWAPLLSQLAVVFTEYARPHLPLTLSRFPLYSPTPTCVLLLEILHDVPLFTSHQIIVLSNAWLMISKLVSRLNYLN